MVVTTSSPLRERTRRAVQGELVDVAQTLMLTKGYEATTVEDIAAGAGMSKRSFFRYFASKDDIVVGQFDLIGDWLATALAARPSGEDPWESVRRMFDLVVDELGQERHWRMSLQMSRLVESTLSLRCAYLERLDRMQQNLAVVLQERAHASGQGIVEADVAWAVVGAGFACLRAAQTTAHEKGSAADLGESLDRLMAALRPSV